MTTEKREPATCKDWCGKKMREFCRDGAGHCGACAACRDDSRCRCSPACARERRRVGDGPAVEVVHAATDSSYTACGVRWLDDDAKFIVECVTDRSLVSCPACLAKTKVEVGQRWRENESEYVVVRAAGGDSWWIRWEDGADVPIRGREYRHPSDDILADTYLGMAPAAPVEGPAPALCCDRAKPVTNASGQPRYWLCRVHPGVTFANGERQRPPLPAPAASPVAEPPAAPVREPGVFFGFALKGLERGEKWRRRGWTAPAFAQRNGHRLTVWMHPLSPSEPAFDSGMPLDFADMVATDWEPLPAPKPGRVAELCEEWRSNPAPRSAEDLVTRAVSEALDTVRRAVVAGHGFENAVYIAKVALLGTETGK